MESAEQPDKDLLTKTSGHLTEGGYNTSPESLDPTHESVIDKIKENLGDTVGMAASAVGTPIQEGFGQSTERIKLAEGLGWRQRLAQRLKGKIHSFRRK